MKILLTGSTGFIGTALKKSIFEKKIYELITPIRSSSKDGYDPKVMINSISQDTDWSLLLSDVDVVIHLAARAHILKEDSIDPLKIFRETNTAGTINLAQQASSSGVKRFIFISSIGVNGNETHNIPFKYTDIPKPIEPYAISKYEAEIAINKISSNSNMETVIIRPPLVYGPNAPGNFGRLFSAISRKMPLPLGSINNKRSLVALDTLINLIIICISHPKASNETFLVSDDEDLSTTALLKKISNALKIKPRLLPIHPYFLKICARILGKKEIIRRLCSSLQVDINHTKDTLDWKPPISVDEALKKIAEYPKNEKNI